MWNLRELCRDLIYYPGSLVGRLPSHTIIRGVRGGWKTLDKNNHKCFNGPRSHIRMERRGGAACCAE